MITLNASKLGFISAKEIWLWWADGIQLGKGQKWFGEEDETELDHRKVTELLGLQIKQQIPSTKWRDKYPLQIVGKKIHSLDFLCTNYMLDNFN